MKKIKLIIFLLLICFSLLVVGCGDNSDIKTPDEQQQKENNPEEKDNEDKDDNPDEKDKDDDSEEGGNQGSGTQEGGTGWLPWV